MALLPEEEFIIDAKITSIKHTGRLELTNLGDINVNDFLDKLDNKVRKKIQKLDISLNDFTKIPQLYSFENIIELTCTHCEIQKLTSLPSSLKKANFCYNRIEKFCLRKTYKEVTELNFDSNQITSLSFLKYFPNLRFVDLRDNPIKKISSELLNARYLEGIVINRVTFNDIKSLKRLLKYKKNLDNFFKI